MGTHYRTGRRGTKQKRDFYIKINGASIPYYFFWGALWGCVGWDCRKGGGGKRDIHLARLSEKGKIYTRAWRRGGGRGMDVAVGGFVFVTSIFFVSFQSKAAQSMFFFDSRASRQ